MPGPVLSILRVLTHGALITFYEAGPVEMGPLRLRKLSPIAQLVIGRIKNRAQPLAWVPTLLLPPCSGPEAECSMGWGGGTAEYKRKGRKGWGCVLSAHHGVPLTPFLR